MGVSLLFAIATDTQPEVAPHGSNVCPEKDMKYLFVGAPPVCNRYGNHEVFYCCD